MNSEIPKQFLKIQDQSIIRHTVKNFKNWGLFKALIIVSPAEFIEKTEKELDDLLDPTDRIIEGGKSRHDSTLNGLTALKFDNDLIVIHDAVRPFVTSKDLDEVTNGALEFGASTLAEKVNETLVRGENQKVSLIIDRENVFSIKTPQVLHSSILKDLLSVELNEDPTDLCSWLKALNIKPVLKESNPLNIKITTNTDLIKAENFIKLFSFE